MFTKRHWAKVGISFNKSNTMIAEKKIISDEHSSFFRKWLTKILIIVA